jgi:hypothetical protein
MLDLFLELGDEVVSSAATPASTLLVDRFKEVDTEILAAFREHGEPLAEAADALVQKQEKVSEMEESQTAKMVESAVSVMPSMESGVVH